MYEFTAKYYFKEKSVTSVDYAYQAPNLKSAKQIAYKHAKSLPTEVRRIEIYHDKKTLACRNMNSTYWSNIYTYSDWSITHDEVAYRLKNDNPDNLSEDDIRRQCYEDSYLYEEAWGDFLNTVGDALDKAAPKGYIRIDGSNLGWRGLSGHKYLDVSYDDKRKVYLNTPEKRARYLLNNIVCDSDSSIQMATHGRHGLYFNITHHDNPVSGDCFDISPVSRREYDEAA